VDETERAFLDALGSSSDLPGLSDVRLAEAACALIRAEREEPGSGRTARMRAAFLATGRADVYEAVLAELSQP